MCDILKILRFLTDAEAIEKLLIFCSFLWTSVLENSAQSITQLEVFVWFGLAENLKVSFKKKIVIYQS
jgi:hypothetical protein